MVFSQTDFNRNAKSLVSALFLEEFHEEGELTLVGDNDSRKDYGFKLFGWELRGVQDISCCAVDTDASASEGLSTLYLFHPAITMMKPSSNNDDDNTLESYGNDDILEDDTILQDNAESLCRTRQNSSEPKQNHCTKWTFSIVYSDAYQVPVLYFHVEDIDGNPCGRQDVLEILRNFQQRREQSSVPVVNDTNVTGSSNDVIPTDTWEFMSQEVHPFLNIPSFFLHPCQSSTRLQSMIKSSDNFDSQQQSGCIDDNMTTNTSILWTWMSMILPAVGQPIPASYFFNIWNNILIQKDDNIVR